MTEDELAYLERIAMILGLSEERWDRLRAANLGPEDSDPYSILGVERRASESDIKRVYRQLVLENHPDKLIADGMPQEFVDIANEKLARINAAHDQIQKERGIN